MKNTILKSLTLVALSLSLLSCGDNDKANTKEGAAGFEPIQELFGEVKQIHVWKYVNGMNSPAYIITDPDEVQKFIDLIGEPTDAKHECEFTGGITYINTLDEKFSGEQMNMAETNLSEGCKTINYFNSKGQMEYHNITKEGMKILQETFDKIPSPKSL